jgi:hypothetical protein
MRSVYKWTRIILILTETVVLAVAKVYFTAREQKGGRADSISLHVVICKCFKSSLTILDIEKFQPGCF